MNLKDKKILITGGSGFIGQHLIKALKKLDAWVYNFDLSEGYDITDENQLAGVIKDKFDVIYHLAGFSGSSESNKNRLKSFRVNTLATVNLCEQIVKYSPRTKLIISSSRLEYGKVQYLPVDEKHPTVPTSAYGLSKLAATQMALVYHLKNNLNVTVFRTSNVYGPHAHVKFQGYNIINYFIDQAKGGQPLVIFGKGEQERDYLYVDDLVDAFLLAQAPRSNGQVYNLGYGLGIKFGDMAKLIIENVGRGDLKFVEWPQDYKRVETGSYISDISKIKKELGFVPKTSFDKGIKRTIYD